MGKKSAFFMLMVPLITVVLPCAFMLLIPVSQRARVEANRAVSGMTIKGIDNACDMYGQNNNGRWPDSLEVLVEQGYLGAAMLVNPNRPELKVGYVYIKPARPADEMPNGVMMIYEAYEQWGDGVQTGVGFITDEAEFKKLLAEATEKADTE